MVHLLNELKAPLLTSRAEPSPNEIGQAEPRVAREQLSSFVAPGLKSDAEIDPMEIQIRELSHKSQANLNQSNLT